MLQRIFGANWLPRVTIPLATIAYEGVTAWMDGSLVLTPKNVIGFVLSGLIASVLKGHNVTGIGDKATTDKAKDATQPTNLAGI